MSTQIATVWINESSGLPELLVGNWRSVINGADEISQVITTYLEADIKTLYELIGFELHAQQQGLSEITWKTLAVEPERIEDTRGSVSAKTTMMVARCRLPLVLLDDDCEVVFRGLV